MKTRLSFIMAWLVLLPAVSCGSGGSRASLAQEGFAQGELQMVEGRYDEAVLSLTQAGEAAAGTHEGDLQGRILLALSDAYANTCFFSEALVSADSARAVFTRLSDSRMAGAATYRMARARVGLEDFAAADSLYTVMLAERGLPEADLPRMLADAALLSVQDLDDPDRAVSLFEEALALTDVMDGPDHWGAYAYALASTGEKARAEAVFKEMVSSGWAESPAYQVWKSRTLALQGDYRTAFDLLEQAARRQHSGMLRMLRQSAVRAQRDYYVLENERIRARDRSMGVIGGLILLILLLLLAAAFLLFRRRDRKTRFERAELLDWASSMENQRDELSLSQARLRSDYAKLYQSYFQKVGRISEIVQNSPDRERGVYYQLSQLIKDIRLDKRGQKQFEAMINRDLDDVMAHFRDDFPSYQEETFRFMSYVFAGFDAATIRLLMEMASDATVHTKKSGIKKVILSSDSPHRDQYLTLL